MLSPSLTWEGVESDKVAPQSPIFQIRQGQNTYHLPRAQAFQPYVPALDTFKDVHVFLKL